MDSKLSSKVLWLVTTLLLLKQYDCQSVTEFCTNSVQTISYRVGSSINITSPDYPSSTYNISHDCEINIDTGSTERFRFRIVQRNLGNESSKCQVDYLMEDASGGLIPRTPNCNLNNDDDSVIDGHHSNSQTGFKLKLPAGSTLGFTLIFTAFTNSSTTNTPPTMASVSTTTSTSTTTLTKTSTSSSTSSTTSKINSTSIRMTTSPGTSSSTNTTTSTSTNLSVTNNITTDLGFSKITAGLSNTTLVKTSTDPEAEETPNALKQFFKEEENIIAVAAGGGGLILVIVIIVLTCLLCRKFKRSRNNDDSIKDKDSTFNSTPHTSNRATGKTCTTVMTYNSMGYSSVELTPTQYSEENVRLDDVDLHYSAVKPGEAPASDITATVVDEGKVEGAPNKVEEEKGGEVVYAVVNKPRVEMFDNDLYASRDSLSSSGEDD